MPAGNPVINTASSVPSPVHVGRDGRTQQRLAHSLPTDPIMRRTTAVPTNEQRRATAKRKIQRQLERRAAKERQRRIYNIVGSPVAAIVVIGAIVATVVVTNKDSGTKTASAATTTPTSALPAKPAAPGQLPASAPPPNLAGNCQYPAPPE